MPGNAAPIASLPDRADEQAGRGGNLDLTLVNNGRGPSGAAAMGTGFCADALVDQSGGSAKVARSFEWFFI